MRYTKWKRKFYFEDQMKNEYMDFPVMVIHRIYIYKMGRLLDKLFRFIRDNLNEIDENDIRYLCIPLYKYRMCRIQVCNIVISM